MTLEEQMKELAIRNAQSKRDSDILKRNEIDPNGFDQHSPGAKMDHGKIKAALIMDFSRALKAVAEVGTFGANKYTRGGWLKVPNGIERYSDAMFRHFLNEHEGIDPDSGLSHAAHAAWNALARLELIMRENEEIERGIDPI